MKVFVLSMYYDNCQDFDINVTGDKVLGVYSSREKAEQTAKEFAPHSFDGAVITETHPTVHMSEGTVRCLSEYVSDAYQYEYELYITEMELDAQPMVD